MLACATGVSFPLANTFICVLTAITLVLSGCKTQGALTADSTHCRTMDVDVIKSRYSREGSTTVWCAKCKDKLYLCVSNPPRSRVECKETAPEACS
jgi:hypothetical protein